MAASSGYVSMIWPWRKFHNRTFRDQPVVLDNRSYFTCEFINCMLIYRGGKYTLNNCKIQNPTFQFYGRASNTVDYIRQLGIGPAMFPSAGVMMQPQGSA